MDRSFVMPPDTNIMDDEARLRLIKSINLCETKREWLETSVIDAALLNFSSTEIFICSAMNPKDGQTSPFYQTELAKLKKKNKFKSARLIVLPLCDGSHFNGYIVDIVKKTIVFIDSMYPRKTGRRSVGAYLADTLLPGDNVLFSSFYDKRYQFDVHSCGAWLVLGMAGYIIGYETANATHSMELAFSLLMTLVENISVNDKLKKTKEMFGFVEHLDNTERCTDDYDYDYDYEEFVKSMSKSKNKNLENDEILELKEDIEDHLFDGSNIPSNVSTSTPTSKKRKRYAFLSDSASSNSNLESSSYPSPRSLPRSRSASRSCSRSLSHSDEIDSNISCNSNKLSDTQSFVDDTHKVYNNSTTDYHPKYSTLNNISNDFIPSMVKNPESEIMKPLDDFMSTDDVIRVLQDKPINVLQRIPSGRKENVHFIISDEDNKHRRSAGKHSVYFDDCGVWDTRKGKTTKEYYHRDNEGQLKHILLKNGVFGKNKKVGKSRVFVSMNPQPSDIFIMHRYYTVLKRSKSYRRRITRINDDVALVEYIGLYPETTSAHGNANNHKDDDYKRTNPKTLEKIASLSKYQPPRDIYKELVKEDSFSAPKDFKQCQNVAHNVRKKESSSKGKKNNFADELLECMELVDNHPFVQQVHKSKGSLPNFILYSDDQIDDIKYFISHQGKLVLGVDRTFNLGSFFVTSFVYKNQRIVRSNNSSEHPLFLGPIYLHRDATFEAYHTFFSSVKATLCKSFDVQGIEVSIGKNIVFGSDEEQALTKAIESVFPSSLRTLCNKHLKENVIAYMANEAGVRQKHRIRITEKIFGDDGLSTADDSALFEKRNQEVTKEAKNYPKFVNYFTKKVVPNLKTYVNGLASKVPSNWTNNNCESLNHIMKLDAKWKCGSTTRLIELLHDIVKLHYRDFRRALYGSGNYRLVKNQKKRFGISKEKWQELTELERTAKFRSFLKNEYKRKTDVVKSTYSNFTVKKPSTAIKPGQKKRVRRSKTSKK